MKDWKNRTPARSLSVTRWTLVLLADIAICALLFHFLSYLLYSWAAATLAFLVATIPTSRLIEKEVI